VNSALFQPFGLTFHENWCLIARRFATRLQLTAANHFLMLSVKNISLPAHLLLADIVCKG
jgi:hypothetical protein